MDCSFDFRDVISAEERSVLSFNLYYEPEI